ncbi:MAG: hypothetical protein HC897_15890 [Thermoanaerobaculia bacterium]|nr:hypothetical protein [Thermoanaerobaculia bacterium]
MLHVLLPLVIGSWIYVVWRVESLRVFTWLDFVGWSPLISWLRSQCAAAEPLVPSWLVFSFPAGAWVYSISMYMWLLWNEVSFKVAGVLMLFGPALGMGSELLQATGHVAGTYDSGDGRMA